MKAKNVWHQETQIPLYYSSYSNKAVYEQIRSPGTAWRGSACLTLGSTTPYPNGQRNKKSLVLMTPMVLVSDMLLVPKAPCDKSSVEWL